MIRLDIYCGLLGSGKTTLIRQLLGTVYAGRRCALIENEAGKVNLDGESFSGLPLTIREVTSGCVCCTVKGDFTNAVRSLADTLHPEYLIVEPSGLADIQALIRGCTQVEGITLNRVVMVVNGKKIESLMRISGDFLSDQLRSAQTVFLNFAEHLSPEKLRRAEKAVLSANPDAILCTKPMDQLTGEDFPEGGVKDPDPISWLLRSRPPTAQSALYRFESPVTQAQLAQLEELLQHDGIWRAKGCLRMEDGRLQKLDAVYGDIYRQTLDSFPAEKTNLLVVIESSLSEGLLTGLGCTQITEQNILP